MHTMTLPTRPLGTSGLTLTTVGFGAWAAGGGGWSFGWGPQDDSASIDAMRHAIAQGVNIVRRELGLPFQYVPASDPQLQIDVVPGRDVAKRPA